MLQGQAGFCYRSGTVQDKFADLLLVVNSSGTVRKLLQLTRSHFKVSSLPDSFFGLFAQSGNTQLNTQILFV